MSDLGWISNGSDLTLSRLDSAKAYCMSQLYKALHPKGEAQSGTQHVLLKGRLARTAIQKVLVRRAAHHCFMIDWVLQ